MSLRIYLDNCCFNRPFDDQHQTRVRIETEAKLCIQEQVRAGAFELAWSYVLDFENAANPFEERRTAIGLWSSLAKVDTIETPEILNRANQLAQMGLKSKDSLHIACAIFCSCEYYVTTDDRILKRQADLSDIELIDPPAFVRKLNL